MRKTILALALSAALPVIAQAAEEAKSPHSLTGNVTFASEYIYRGIGQTNRKPAVQAGFDYGHSSGIYLGTWGSNVSWVSDTATTESNSVELDFYGGYKGSAGDIGYDVGVLQYLYPSNKLHPSANTFELYGALTFGPVTAKYSHSATNLFGYADSKNSGYFDVTATFDLGDGLSLAPHVGHQTVKHLAAASYTDYSLTLAKDFSGLVVSGAIIGTDANKTTYASPVNGKFMGKSMLVVGLKKTF